MRASTTSRRRFQVLGLVQLAMVVHVGLWLLAREYGWWGGQTVAPLEPSEAMQTVGSGEVNAGAILFGVLLLSTLVWGRWFCGWGCHVVLLQDLCAGLMRRLGLRPRPFRTRWLPLFGLGLALYMFVWPLLERWLVSQGWWTARVPLWQWRLHVTTADYWAGFPGPWLAVPFLFICGFAAVYFLGAKGFCTYGCPYGALFVPLDRLSRFRIRVDESCAQCGHCSVACSSNVRVHEEVGAYGAVVDPGCMKCLDCVSVCPNGALSVGWGSSARQALAAPRLASQRPPARRVFDATVAEELVLGGVLLGSFLAFYMAYSVVPLLMAAAMASITTFTCWKSYRLLRRRTQRLHGQVLKRGGNWTRGGVTFVVGSALLLALALHTGAVRTSAALGRLYDGDLRAASKAMQGAEAPVLDDAHRQQAELAISWYSRAASVAAGGIGLMADPAVLARLGGLNAFLQRFDVATVHFERALQIAGPSDERCRDLAWTRYMSGDRDKAIAGGLAALEDTPGMAGLRYDVVGWQLDGGDHRAAARTVAEGLALGAAELTRAQAAWRAIVQGGRPDLALPLISRAAVLWPDDAEVAGDHALGSAAAGDEAAGRRIASQALARWPRHGRLNGIMAEILSGLGEHALAARHRRAAAAAPAP